MLQQWKDAARRLKIETYALYLAYRDPRVAWPARIFAACVVGYAFSPIDLIPDFIPVLGQLDDLVIVPLGVAIARRAIPPVVLEESREKARVIIAEGRPRNRFAAVAVIAIWLAVAAWVMASFLAASK